MVAAYGQADVADGNMLPTIVAALAHLLSTEGCIDQVMEY
jgi:hypothetical protein